MTWPPVGCWACLCIFSCQSSIGDEPTWYLCCSYVHIFLVWSTTLISPALSISSSPLCECSSFLFALYLTQGLDSFVFGVFFFIINHWCLNVSCASVSSEELIGDLHPHSHRLCSVSIEELGTATVFPSWA
ncbi:hypothetical protein L211DRAFT_58536 [Terfezia boudieri ATCC MYA-4762]|uniref:Secreted protein n=1 Tax=Terfezia boudieri ATCC MYA-4762 TaxID=1051890 RepID=A0A3N4LYR0_9PEZI|nr:hypothetical protein L211DRAFT_58536 [Terfezia boudieri ATCC MYA-4762]